MQCKYLSYIYKLLVQNKYLEKLYWNTFDDFILKNVSNNSIIK